MPIIAYLDTEITQQYKIADIGCVFDDGRQLHTASVAELTRFLQGADFICGHNILAHDLRFVQNAVQAAGIPARNAIDTLPLSPLLFPVKPYHRLVKNDKLQTDETNNPLNDAKKARDLFHDEVAAFQRLDATLQQIFGELLYAQPQFDAFFRYLGFSPTGQPPVAAIFQKFRPDLCSHAEIDRFAREKPIELAYTLALIHSHDRKSITPRWVLHHFPALESVMTQLRSRPCLTGCLFCNQQLDIFKGLRYHFNFEAFRTYAGEPLQERAVRAAVEQMSLLVIFPTGGGKSITFQLPALMSGQSVRGLTVVISPLQSLMKDQVDNLEAVGITEAVTINGLLDPIERAKSFERVENGSASLLYISPESLRSKSIERLLLGRNVVRFVIDEAHCFSSWGQDFRVDYLYIGDFIKALQEKKNRSEPIPVSCFTATAKRKVVEDICQYFKEKLGLELEIFRSTARRTNLHYHVFEKGDGEEKYQKLRDLITEKNCPTIVYVSRTRTADKLTARLVADGFQARAFHGKKEAAEKIENQNAFIEGETPIMVATSAFGMGVDKKDVGLVVHFEISGSLEDYVQEAGRAGRDETMNAECFVLFNEDDLNKHFALLNQSKLTINEINQVWKAIKFITKYRLKATQSALEIARRAGWGDEAGDFETRITTAIAALEDAGYLRRGQNQPRVFANSILSKTAQEAIEKINASNRFDNDQQKINATRIVKKLFSSKSKKWVSDEAAEERVDYISDQLGIPLREVVSIVEVLRSERILADARDLTAFIKRGENRNRSHEIAENFQKIEQFLLRQLDGEQQDFHLKMLNEAAENAGIGEVSPAKIKTLLNFWAIKNWVKRRFSNQIVVVQPIEPPDVLFKKWEQRRVLIRSIIEFLYDRSRADSPADAGSEEILTEFSVQELLENYHRQPDLFGGKSTTAEVEDALFYLSRIEALKIEGGFMVVYNRLSIDRLEQNSRVQYKNDDYQKLRDFYEHRVQQIHIVGEYAKKMVDDYGRALQFVDDYFQLNFSSFLGKYFPGSRQTEITRNITPAKYRQLFGSLSEEQRRIINDRESHHIVVAAAPGSGKTKVLVHKLAALLLMEDVKSEQLLMLTFSRAAATEFKTRLIALIREAAYFVEIKTFHSYCFDVLGRVGSVEKSDKILQTAIEKIESGEVETSRITKTVLVVDEAQDMNAEEFALVNILMKTNPQMRVIAVGDDDQNIFEFRGADSRHLSRFVTQHYAQQHELTINFRSLKNLVDFSDQFARQIPNRMKTSPVVAHRPESGNLKIVQYRSRYLLMPLAEDLLATDLQGSVGVLTKTNDEAAQIAGILLRCGRQAKLIQSNDGFSLQNLAEIRFFMNALRKNETSTTVLNEEVWGEAKRAVWEKFRSSSKVEILINLVKKFEASHPKLKYWTDFESFVRESKIEDFYLQTGDTIFVSTIHKAKGKEFDHVFLLLDHFDDSTAEAKRQIYVAITRAKNHLTIHTNGRHFDHLQLPEINRFDITETWQPTDEIACQLTLNDVNLGYFPFVQHRAEQLTSGDALQIVPDGLTDENGKLVIKFSLNFQKKIEQHRANGFDLVAAKVNFLVWWKNQENEQEYLTVLPELVLKRPRK